MNMKDLSQLLSTYIPMHFIVNHKHDILAISNKCKKLTQFNEISIKDILVQIPDSGLNDSKTLKLVSSKQGRKYSLDFQPFKIESDKHIIISLQELCISKDPHLKLHCLEEIINKINDGIIVSDSEGKIIIYNPAQEKLEDLSSKEIRGKYLWEAYNYQSIELSEHRDVFNSGKSIVNGYSAHSHKNGISKYLSYSTYPIYKNDEVVAVYSISKNETTLKNLLTETIELKRKLRNHSAHKKTDFENGTRFSFSDIIGNSEKTSQIVSEAEGMSLFENNLLIVGETGTGKEVFAQSIHNLGHNKTEPFVAINCGAIPENLLESTLFGTVKGSYTGAVDQIGLFEEAQSGTLFLDELNSMPITMQSKLLRVLQERKVRPVGSQKTIPINCRIISAINDDPQKIIKAGLLRQDLFYRIAGLHLHIPPLRERLDDVTSLSQHFICRCNKLLNKNVNDISSDLKDIFFGYHWPGNIRELEHVIENLMIRVLDSDRELRIEHMPPYTKSTLLGAQAKKSLDSKSGSLTNALKDIERRMILEQLIKNNWNISQTSRDLGIVRQSLIYRIKKLDITKP